MFRIRGIDFQVMNLLRRQITPMATKQTQHRCRSFMSWKSTSELKTRLNTVNRSPQLISKRHNNPIVEGGEATYRPTPFEQKVLVWTKTYPAIADIPERISRGQMKKAADKFRVRCSVAMVAMTFIFAAMMALIGRKARNEGQSVTRMTLARREREREE